MNDADDLAQLPHTALRHLYDLVNMHLSVAAGMTCTVPAADERNRSSKAKSCNKLVNKTRQAERRKCCAEEKKYHAKKLDLVVAH